MNNLVRGGLIGAAALVGGYVILEFLNPLINRSGATKDEHRAPAPGEDLLEGARIGSTHAINIEAPPDEVWKWIVQIGQNRGGFYSYAWLENLVGCQMKNVDRIIPELQTLNLGDKVYLHPKAPPLTVTVLEPNRAMALEGWVFQVKRTHENRTRLITRSYVLSPNTHMGRLGNFIVRTAAFDFAHFIMERKMLKTIKALAERNFLRRTENAGIPNAEDRAHDDAIAGA